MGLNSLQLKAGQESKNEGAPGKVAALVDFGKVNTSALLSAWRRDFQHPGCRIKALLNWRHPLDSLQKQEMQLGCLTFLTLPSLALKKASQSS